MTEQEWRDNLRAGDEVFISARFGSTPSKGVVSRTTKTQILVRINHGHGTSESAYRKKDGYRVGGSSYYYSRLIMPTDEIREKVYIHSIESKAKRLIENIDIPKDKDGLVKFIEIMKQFVPEVPK